MHDASNQESGSGTSRRRGALRGFTLVEVIVAMVVASIVVVCLYRVFGFLFTRRTAGSLSNMTERSYIHKDLRIATRKLCTRIREGVQVIEPKPGQTGEALVFRDLLNDLVRIRLIAGETTLISEHMEGGSYRRETRPTELVTDQGHTIRPVFPIKIKNCVNASFTAISPTCVVVHLTITYKGNHDAIMTSIALRNKKLAI